MIHRFALLFTACSPLLGPAQSAPGRFFEPFAARTDTPITSQPPAGQVTVHPNASVDRLMERFTTIKHPQPGFRVQVFLGERKNAEEAKRAFLQKNPDVPAYLSWLAPNWRLRVGDCRTRLEAERLLRDLKLMYPGSYIVPEEIEMPR